MAAHALTGALRLVWNVQDQWGEDIQWGIHCGAKLEAEYGDIYTAMDSFFTALDANDVLADCHLTQLSIQAWASTPGYVGFHGVSSVSRNVASTTTEEFPPQVALAIGYRNTDSEGLGLRLQSRRNRFFLGPLSITNIDTGGSRMSDERRDLIGGLVHDLSDALGGVTEASGWSSWPKFVVTSPRNDVAMKANQIVLGRAFDTMRSRRQKVPEDVATISV